MENPLKIELPIYQSLYENKSGEFVKISEFLNRIKGGHYKKLIEYARSLPEVEYKQWKKEALPAISLSSYLNNREKSSKIENQNYTGLIQLDFDKVENPVELRDQLKADKHILAAFISPSGKGVKGIVSTNNLEVDKHKESWNHVDNYYYNFIGLKNDKNVKDVKRVLLVSYDPDIYINENCIPLEIPVGLIEKSIKDEQQTYSSVEDPKVVLSQACDRIKLARHGEKHDTRLRYSRLVGGYVSGMGLDKEYAFNELTKSALLNTSDSVKAIKDIENGFKNGLISPITKKSKSKSKELPCEFWEFTSAKEPELKINYTNLFEVIHWYGFKNVKIYDNDNYQLVFVKNNTLSIASKEDILNFVVNDLPKLVPEKIECGYTRLDLKEKLLKGISHYINKDKISGLKRSEISIVSDTKNESFLPFCNKIAHITLDKVSPISYINLKATFWKNSILKRDLDNKAPYDPENCDFHNFLKNTCTDKNTGEVDELRFKSLRQTIGYLLTNYKSNNYYPAIIFLESTDSEEPEGGTGKSLIIKAIGHFRNIIYINGRSYNPKSQFAIQNVNFSTDIIAIQEVDKYFKFDSLFSYISDGMTVERKFKDPIYIPANKTPKIVISSNFAIPGRSGSYERRRFDMELLPFYNIDHQPINDFGKMFFSSEWTDIDWNHFNMTMMSCIQEFYRNNCEISNYKSKTLDMRNLLAEVKYQEFIDFAQTLEYDKKYNNQELCQMFRNEYDVNNTWDYKLSDREILRKVKKVLELEGLSLEVFKSGSKRGFIIKNGTKGHDKEYK